MSFNKASAGPAAVSVKVAKKKSRSTARQLETLVDLMTTNKNLALGRFTGPMGAEKNGKLWDAVAHELSIIGPAKSKEQAKSTWRDLKKRVRTQNAKRLLVRRQTGNPDAVPELSDLEKKVLNVIGTESSEGIGDSETGFEGEEMEASYAAVVQLPDLAESPELVEINNYEIEPVHFSDSLQPEGGLEPINSTPMPATVAATTPVPRSKRMLLGNHNGKAKGLEATSSAPVATFSTGTAAGTTPAPRAKARMNLGDMDDIAKGYADLQKENNKILSDMSNTLNSFTEKCLAILKEKNEIARERNEIEKEKNRMKMKQINMLMRNTHNDDDENDEPV